MDQKKGPNRRSKRQSKLADDCYWDCSVCTYRNSAEAFKCLMCDIRKGTSTRKPRINPQLVAQQVAQQYTQSIPKIRKEESPVLKTEMGMPILPEPSPPPPPLPPVVVVPLPAPKPERLQAPKPERLPVPKPEKLPTPKPERLPVPKPERAEKRNGSACEGRKSRKARPKLKNVDRSSAQHKAVTVNNVTVIITEFQPKRHQSSSSSSEHNNCLPPIGNRHGPAPPTVNGCGAPENGNHSDSTNLSNDLHSDGRSS